MKSEEWLTGKSLTALGSLCKKAVEISTIAASQIKNAIRVAESAEPVAVGIGKVEELKPSRIQMWFNQIEE